MRTQSRNLPQASALGRDLAVLLVSVALFAQPVSAGVDLLETGRRTRTAEKLPMTSERQASPTDPSSLQSTVQRQPRPRSGLTWDRRQRRIHAYPRLPVSVGLVGCPGCPRDEALLRGIFLDLGPRLDARFRGHGIPLDTTRPPLPASRAPRPNPARRNR